MICFILSLPISNRGRNDIPFRSWRWSILRPPWSFLAAWSRQVLHGSQTLAHADGEQYQYSLCFVKMKDLYIVYIYIYKPISIWGLSFGMIIMHRSHPYEPYEPICGPPLWCSKEWWPGFCQLSLGQELEHMIGVCILGKEDLCWVVPLPGLLYVFFIIFLGAGILT